jgi:hypothetical protein
MAEPQSRTPGAGPLDDAEPPGALRDRPGSQRIRWSSWAKFGAIMMAAVMMTVAGAFSVLEGLLALLSPTFFLNGGGRVLALNLTAWGWLHIVLGALMLVTGVGLWAGASASARTVTVGLIAINILVQLVWLPAYPIWSIFILAFDLIVLYALATISADWHDMD